MAGLGPVKNYLYACAGCKEKFKTLIGSRNHMREKHGKEKFVCGICRENKQRRDFTKPTSLLDHLSKEHGIKVKKSDNVYMSFHSVRTNKKRKRSSELCVYHPDRKPQKIKIDMKKAIVDIKMEDGRDVSEIYISDEHEKPTRGAINMFGPEPVVMEKYEVKDLSRSSITMDAVSKQKIQIGDLEFWINPSDYEYGEHSIELDDGSTVVMSFFPDEGENEYVDGGMPILEKPKPISPIPPLEKRDRPQYPPGYEPPTLELKLDDESTLPPDDEESSTFTLDLKGQTFDIYTGFAVNKADEIDVTPPNEIDSPKTPFSQFLADFEAGEAATPKHRETKHDYESVSSSKQDEVGSSNRCPVGASAPPIPQKYVPHVPGGAVGEVKTPKTVGGGASDIVSKDIKDLIQDGTQDDISEVKKRLAQQQVKKNVTYDNGQSLLHLATQHGKLDIVKALLSNGFSVKQKNGDGLYPLMIAAKEGFKDIAHTLLQSKANLQFATEKDKMTPLMFAAQAGKIDCIKLFLSHPVPANKKDILDMKDVQERTPLHIAVEHRQTEATVSLLKADANPNLKDQNGNTVEELARRNGEVFMRHYWHAIKDRTPLPPQVETPRLGREGSRLKGRWQPGNSSPRTTPSLYSQRSTIGPVTPIPRTPIPRTPAPRTPKQDEKDTIERFEEDPPTKRSLQPPGLQKYASTGGIRSGFDSPWYAPGIGVEDRIGLMDIVHDLMPEASEAHMAPEHFLGHDLSSLENYQLSLVEQACTKILIKARDQKILNMINHVMIKEDNFRADTQRHLQSLRDDIGTLNACWDRQRREQEAREGNNQS